MVLIASGTAAAVNSTLTNPTNPLLVIYRSGIGRTYMGKIKYKYKDKPS